jgi:hypothetical protein
VMEPSAPGADEIVISLYDTMDVRALQAHRAEIHSLFARNACLRSRAARYVASVGSLLLDNRRAAACCSDLPKARTYARHLAARLLPKTDSHGSEQLRFLTGITPQGPMFYEETVRTLASRYIVFHDEHGACARVLMEVLRGEALARGYSIITCPCALHPDDKIDHIFVPALGLAFLTSNSWHECRFAHQQNIRCLRFMDLDRLTAYRSRMRFNHKASAELLHEAVQLMAQAKACHDKLEEFYRSAIDFSAVDAAEARCEALLNDLFAPKA